jgi:hypothetical protein
MPHPMHGLERLFLVLGPRRPPLLPGHENLFALAVLIEVGLANSPELWPEMVVLSAETT